jgi:hypothetical protein
MITGVDRSGKELYRRSMSETRSLDGSNGLNECMIAQDWLWMVGECDVDDYWRGDIGAPLCGNGGVKCTCQTTQDDPKRKKSHEIYEPAAGVSRGWSMGNVDG